MKKIISLILLALLFVSVPITIHADESFSSSSSSAKLEVNGVANPIERFKEKLTSFFKFSDNDKADYNNYLLKKRFDELKYIIESGQGDRIEEVSSRYSTYLGKSSDFILNKKLKNKKDEMMQIYNQHLQELDQMQRNFEFDSGLWKLIEYDNDIIKIFSRKMSEMK